MCGIYGWSIKAGKKKKIGTAQLESLSTGLAIGNSFRGNQSWGAYLVDKDRKSEVQRHVGDIANASVAWMGSYPVVMAHTRYATTGRISVENAHPFTVGDVTLAHNGVIFNHLELERKHKRDCDVDSIHFAHHVNEGLPFDDIEGYGAIEWARANDPSAIHLCRLAGGSLSVYGLKGENGKQIGVAWSSDDRHLKAALGGARIECFPYEPLKEGQVYSIEHGRMFVLKEKIYKLAESRRSLTLYQSRTSGSEIGKNRVTYFSGRDGTNGWWWDRDNETWRGIEPEAEEDHDLYERLAREDFARVSEAAGATRELSLTDPDLDAGLERLGKLTPIDGGMWVNEAGEIIELDEAEEKLWIHNATKGD
jgi:hypothetical protein